MPQLNSDKRYFVYSCCDKKYPDITGVFYVESSMDIGNELMKSYNSSGKRFVILRYKELDRQQIESVFNTYTQDESLFMMLRAFDVERSKTRKEHFMHFIKNIFCRRES
jgi:hypothetical protein